MSANYQQLTVPNGSAKQSVKKFVESKGHTYSAGSVFVELTEPELVSSDKTYIGTEDHKTFLTGKVAR